MGGTSHTPPSATPSLDPQPGPVQAELAYAGNIKKMIFFRVDCRFIIRGFAHVI